MKNILTAGYVFAAVIFCAQAEPAADNSQSLLVIKNYLVENLQKMDAAAHDFVTNAAAYQAIIDAAGGDYDRAAMEHGVELGELVKKMQADFGRYHNHGYETVEGIVAGTKKMVYFDNYLDGGVPANEASTDSPESPLVLKARDGTLISNHNGNLFHYVIEPTLWGTRAAFLKKLSPEAQAKLKEDYEAELKVKINTAPVALPRADVLTAASIDCAAKLDELLQVAQAWQPTLGECIGALVWMTPTLNGYFDDWRDSRYNRVATGHYVAESRVLDMRGIMFSLQVACDAIVPLLQPKNPGLAEQLKFEYANIISFIDRVEERDAKSGYKMSIPAIEELAEQAKTMTDQLQPQLRQMAAILNAQIPPKPTLE
jgi:Imelysin